MAEFVAEQRDDAGWVFAKCVSGESIFLFGPSVEDVSSQIDGAVGLFHRVKAADEARRQRLKGHWRELPRQALAAAC